MRLYLLPLAEAEKLPEGYAAAHYPERAGRAGRFRRREDALRCLGAGALLCGVLGIAENMLQKSPCGKPFVPDLPRQFNLSHSGEYIALATDETPVGVDVERISADHLSVADRVLQPEERRWMAQAPESRFFRLWTMKESVMKAIGRGLSLDPASFSALPLLEGQPITLDGQMLFGHTLDLPGHSLSLCGCAAFAMPEPVWLTAAALTGGSAREAP